MQRVYLDHAASTPCDPRVLAAMQPFFFEQGGNASSPHQSGRAARKAIEEARELLAAFLGAQPNEIVFTSGASESNNHAIFATAKALKPKGRHIIASAIEHHSVLEPLGLLAQEGFEVSLIKPASDGVMTCQDIQNALRDDTILVCLMHANNQIGTLQPVKEVGALCRDRGIYFLLDATQTVGHLSVDLIDIPCDFLSLSAHKFYGPQGIGALYIRHGLDLPSLIWGGDQERGRRAGTQNTAGIVGLGKAINLCKAQMAEAARRETAMRDSIIDFVLKEIPGATLNGHRHNRLPNNAHFSFPHINAEELVSALDMSGIAVSMGSACTWGRLEPSHVLLAIGLNERLALGSLRISLGRWTSDDDVKYFLEQLKIKIQQLGTL